MWSFRNSLLSVRSCLREIFPLNCPVCGKAPFDGSPNMLCAECFRKLDLIREPFCPGCGGHLSGFLNMCPDCMNADAGRPWQKAFALFRMEGLGRELVHKYKYRNMPELARTLAHLAAIRLGESILAEKFDCITPTPLHFLRYLKRGYNQADLFANVLAGELKIPCSSLLWRKKWTSQQSKLTKKQRISNLNGAFSVKNSQKTKNRAILLVDDVMTTGSTLASAAQVLLDGGAERVGVLVIARRQ